MCRKKTCSCKARGFCSQTLLVYPRPIALKESVRKCLHIYITFKFVCKQFKDLKHAALVRPTRRYSSAVKNLMHESKAHYHFLSIAPQLLYRNMVFKRGFPPHLKRLSFRKYTSSFFKVQHASLVWAGFHHIHFRNEFLPSDEES